MKLKRGGYTATVDTWGGELVPFKDEQGMEYIWGGAPKSWTGQNPNLFPVVGNLIGGKIAVNRKPYICLEPWHGCAALEGESGDFADKPHVIHLGPDEEEALRYSVMIC